MDDRTTKPQIEVLDPSPSEEGESKQPCKSVLSFFTLEDLDVALRYSNFAVQEEIATLVQIAQNEMLEPVARMAALDRIRKHAMTALHLSGSIGTLTTHAQGELPSGLHVEARLDGKRLLDPEQTRQLLENTLHAKAVLEAPTLDVMEVMEDSDAIESGDTRKHVDPSAEEDRGEHRQELPARPGGAIVKRPERDLGGGGLCASAQREAAAARAEAAAAREAREAAEHGVDTRAAAPGGGPAEGGESPSPAPEHHVDDPAEGRGDREGPALQRDPEA